ncbi:Cystathionine beta-lyase PatB [bioreactor metagenome]|uniref:cysteine-S-conjugate beta-lyase n=1 Tax=bioreactor metagenome TaxID=1076179 RepID=A0A645FGE1_9ZZZZ
MWIKDELEKVAAICLKHDVLIISDEIHFDLIMPGYEHTVMATLSDEVADKCIVCTAPSKTFNLAGMQTSNLVINNENQ